ncbi:hypothetical protein WJX74_006702 [Apatococcus lobatus]|uniref:Uncharacterized protein n=1 Tax=Apatococcus lobatus TaxID=904363 RepID=A0AAW1PRD2_9CHLO
MPPVPGRLRGRVAVVSGGGNGIGTGICERLASEGAVVWVLDIDERAANLVASGITGKGFEAQAAVVSVLLAAKACRGCNQVDTSDEEQVQHFFQALPHLDILCSNAALYVFNEAENITEDDWDRVLSVNVKGYSFMLKHAARLMKQNGGNDHGHPGGAIINVASISGWIGQPGFGPYSASKGAVLQLSKCAAIDLGKYGIRVNTVCPGPILTEGTKRHAAGSGQTVEELIAEMTCHMIMHRLGKVEEVAAAVSFLASDDAAFITASNLVVDGGYTAL